MKIRTIKVVPNPYSALDADGRPQGVVSKEGHGDLYVGAVLDVEESNKTGKHIYRFLDDGEIEVPASAYYMRRLQAGELLPADLDAAKYAGVDPKDFEPPESALAKARERASETFEEANGRLPLFALQAKKTN